MRQVGVYDAKTQLPRLLDDVERTFGAMPPR